MMRFFFIIFLGLLNTLSVAQTKRVDSLLQNIYKATTEKEKLQHVLLLCDEYKALNRDTLDKYAYMAKDLASKKENAAYKWQADMALAYDYYLWGWTDSSILVLNKVLEKHPPQNPATRPTYYKAVRLKGMTYGASGRDKEAIEVLLSLIENAEKYKDSIVVGENANTLAHIAIYRKQLGEAEKWLDRAKKFSINNSVRNSDVMAANYVLTGSLYLAQKKYDSAIIFNKKGSTLYKQHNNIWDYKTSLQLRSSIYLAHGKMKEAEAALLEMQYANKQLMNEGGRVDDNILLGDFYVQTHQIDKAIALYEKKLLRGSLSDNDTIQKAFANQNNIRVLYLDKLAACYKLKGNYILYSQTLQQLIDAKDSLYQTNSAEAIADLQTKYEVTQKEATIAAQQLSITKKNYLFYSSLLFVLLSCIIAWLMFKDYRRKQKIKWEQLHEEEKRLSTEAIAKAEEKERQRIAADLHDNLGAYAAAISSNVDILENNQQADEFQLTLDELQTNAHTMIAQLSDTIWALNKESLSITAISDRIKTFVSRIEKSYPHINIEIKENINADTVFAPTVAFHIFQMSQEAINNALKHSRSNTICIEIDSNTKWQIQFIDNGIGMNEDAHKKQNSNGIRNLKIRAQESGLKISWRANDPAGTIVTIEQQQKNEAV